MLLVVHTCTRASDRKVISQLGFGEVFFTSQTIDLSWRRDGTCMLTSSDPPCQEWGDDDATQQKRKWRKQRDLGLMSEDSFMMPEC